MSESLIPPQIRRYLAIGGMFGLGYWAGHAIPIWQAGLVGIWQAGLAVIAVGIVIYDSYHSGYEDALDGDQ